MKNQKPIIKELSEIVKETTQFNETFIPLVELFKISRGVSTARYKHVSIMSHNQIMIEMLGHRNYYFSLERSFGDVDLGEGLHFRSYSTNLINEDKRIEEVQFQNLLFQKLRDWGF